MLLIDVHKVSLVSARKLRCPSSAQLGSQPSQTGLAQLGKFQLELITTLNPLISINLWIFLTLCIWLVQCLCWPWKLKYLSPLFMILSRKVCYIIEICRKSKFLAINISILFLQLFLMLNFWKINLFARHIGLPPKTVNHLLVGKLLLFFALAVRPQSSLWNLPRSNQVASTSQCSFLKIPPFNSIKVL